MAPRARRVGACDSRSIAPGKTLRGASRPPDCRHAPATPVSAMPRNRQRYCVGFAFRLRPAQCARRNDGGTDVAANARSIRLRETRSAPRVPFPPSGAHFCRGNARVSLTRAARWRRAVCRCRTAAGCMGAGLRHARLSERVGAARIDGDSRLGERVVPTPDYDVAIEAAAARLSGTGRGVASRVRLEEP